MANTTNLQLNAVDPNGNALQTNIPYANPAASNANLAAFAKKANSLTQNTYVDTKRVDVTSLNEATAEEEGGQDG